MLSPIHFSLNLSLFSEFCFVIIHTYHDTKGEAGNDAVFGRNCIELESRQVACKDLRRCPKRILCNGCENGGARNTPDSLVLLLGLL